MSARRAVAAGAAAGAGAGYVAGEEEAEEELGRDEAVTRTRRC